MKLLEQVSFSTTILGIYLGYTIFNPIPANAAVIFALSALFAYEKYIQSQKLPSINKALEDLKMEFQKQIAEQKAGYEHRLQVVEDELGKQAIAKANSSSSSKGPAKPQTAVRF